MSNVIRFPEPKSKARAKSKAKVPAPPKAPTEPTPITAAPPESRPFIFADFLADASRFSATPSGHGCWQLNDEGFPAGVALTPKALREIARHCLNIAAMIENKEVS